jgi:hypothetical protein
MDVKYLVPSSAALSSFFIPVICLASFLSFKCPRHVLTGAEASQIMSTKEFVPSTNA